jgi:linoleoyl-CoA desaturase
MQALERIPSRLKFDRADDFHLELHRRVDQYFESTGLSRHDCPAMYWKTAVILFVFAASYILLVFFATTWLQAIPLAILLGLGIAGIGFNIEHDGVHQAFSRYPWVNKVMSLTLDLVGGSSYLWRHKHVVIHHTYVNITHVDTDIELGVLGRLSPHQPRMRFHAWQHLYLWPLYGMLAMKWQLFDDFRDVLIGRIGENPVPRPQRWELVLFLAGKVTFLTLAFGIPLLIHPLSVVLAGYAIAAVVSGLVMSVVFQLAHAVEETEFPLPVNETGRIEHTFFRHQIETTMNFACDNRMVTWMVGGLNFQIEHHLFPRICHIHYPALSRIVEATCDEYGVRYRQQESFFAAIGSHYRWLRLMGSQPAVS